MLSQIFATAIFLIMFIFIVIEVVERHIVSLICALLTIVLVFGLCMQDMTAIVDTINIKSLFTVEFWYHSGEAEGSSAGINWETIIFIFGMMVMVEGMARVGFTVILFLAAVTIELAQLLKFNPIPMILSEIFCANLGGSATMCGDPPNIIIGTSLGYSFMDFVKENGEIPETMIFPLTAVFWALRERLRC